MKTVTPEEYREGMSRVAGAVHLITVEGENGRNGATAVALSSVTDEPATLLVCLNASSQTASSVIAKGRFFVNTLSGDDQSLADIFAGRGGLKGEEKFAHGAWRGAVLTTSLVTFECVIENHSQIGTHEVIFGRVEQVRLGENQTALLYHNRGYAKL